MAEVIVVPLAKSIVGKISSFIVDLFLSSEIEKIKATKSIKIDLKIIAEKLEEIIAFLADVEVRQYTSNTFKIWLRDLKSVVYDIDDLLDEVATDALMRKVNKGHLARQIRYYLSSSTPLRVRLEDDVTKWLELKNLLTIGSTRSMILITTRSHRVATITGTDRPYTVDKLPVDVCWTIFKQIAFAEGEEERYRDLVRIGRSIVEKCNGIPLVVKSLGSLLRNERDEHQWLKINDMDSFVGLHGQYEKKVMSNLKLSYNNLPSHLKPYFVHLSLFVKNAPLQSVDMIHWWSALGLLQGEIEIESTGYSYFSELVSRSLLHETQVVLKNLYFSKCKMHELIHDLATYIMGEELSTVTLDKMKVSQFTRHIIWGNEGSNSLTETTFPKQLSKAPNIRSFKFGYKINKVSRSFLEGIISNFTNLRILDLGLSAFEELPNTVGDLKHLRILDISNNCVIRSLPNSICNLLNLESFNLFGCEELEKRPNDICLLQNLRTFVVTTCQIKL